MSDEYDGPADDDGFIIPAGMLGSKVNLSVDEKHIGVFSTENEAIKEFERWCEKNSFWPSLWRVSDHGNFVPIDLQWEDDENDQ